jgi:hypothetical protein
VLPERQVDKAEKVDKVDRGLVEKADRVDKGLVDKVGMVVGKMNCMGYNHCHSVGWDKTFYILTYNKIF